MDALKGTTNDATEDEINPCIPVLSMHTLWNGTDEFTSPFAKRGIEGDLFQLPIRKISPSPLCLRGALIYASG